MANSRSSKSGKTNKRSTPGVGDVVNASLDRAASRASVARATINYKVAVAKENIRDKKVEASNKAVLKAMSVSPAVSPGLALAVNTLGRAGLAVKEVVNDALAEIKLASLRSKLASEQDRDERGRFK